MDGLDVRIRGAAELRRVADRIRAEGRKDMSRDLSSQINKALAPIKESIRVSAGETMPHEGGYAEVFVKSLNWRQSRQTSYQSAHVVLRTFADGHGERRDIEALEAGRLRHPVFGRSRPGARKGERHANPWTVTSIRAGFHKRGTDEAMDEVERNIISVVDDLAKRLAK